MNLKPAFICILFVSTLSAQTTVTVSTPAELLKAIGSNKTIYLNPGDYVLTSVVGEGSSNVSWEDEYDGSQILISNVSNLKIIGKGTARVLVSPQYTWVMKFYNCSNVTLDNYTLGHTAGGSCTGGVIYLDSCKNVRVNNCKMFGSGTYGMGIYNTENVTVEKCDIYKCTYGLLQLSNSKNLLFTHTRFRETGEFDLITISACKSVTFKTCVFEKNGNNTYSEYDYSYYYFFKIDDGYDYSYYGNGDQYGISSNISINTCQFRDNKIAYFTNDYGAALRLGDNRYERNAFSNPLPTATKPTSNIYTEFKF
jgi:parallel beta-helix repeat protein